VGQHHNLGVLLHNLKLYEESKKEFCEAIRINPNFAEAKHNLEVSWQDNPYLGEANMPHKPKIEGENPLSEG